MTLDQLCLHTITTKPWSLEEAIDHYQSAGVGGISVWQNAIEAMGAEAAGRRLRASGLDVVSYVRGGFFPSVESKARQQAIDDNKRLLDEAAAIGAPLLVLVCGAEPRQPLSESRKQIQTGIEAVLPHAKELGVRLGIEPLHPMYADTRSAVNTLGQDSDIAEAIDHDHVGVVVDVYHLWWDPELEQQIRRCGTAGHLFAYHICDWRVPTTDLLLDRELMGEGCIPLSQIRQWVRDAGFQGYEEVEVFSSRYWEMDQQEFLNKITKAYQDYVHKAKR